MKKFLAFVLTFVATCTMFMACSSDGDTIYELDYQRENSTNRGTNIPSTGEVPLPKDSLKVPDNPENFFGPTDAPDSTEELAEL